MQKPYQHINDRERMLSRIRNFYWHLRTIRPGQGAKRRQLYRRIAKLKAVLISDGLDAEYLRLYCRQYASLDRAAVARFEAYAVGFGKNFEKTQDA